MRGNVRKVGWIGGGDLKLLEALRELQYRTERVSGDSVVALARRLHAVRASIVHAAEAQLKATLVGRLLGIPVILQVGSRDVSAIVGHAARMADRTLCGGAAVREELVDFGAPASSTVVLRGLTEIAAQEASPGLEPLIDPAARWVVCPSPCDGPDRGTSDALLAFSATARTRPSVRLLLNAEGRAAEALLAQAAASNLAGRVFAQPLSPAQLPFVLSRATVVIGASRSGAYPDPIPEALAAGAAVIATAVGPHPTWVREGQTGLLVPARAPVALAARLSSLLDDAVLGGRLRKGARASALDAASPRAAALELARTYAGVSRPQAARPVLFLPVQVRA